MDQFNLDNIDSRTGSPITKPISIQNSADLAGRLLYQLDPVEFGMLVPQEYSGPQKEKHNNDIRIEETDSAGNTFTSYKLSSMVDAVAQAIRDILFQTQQLVGDGDAAVKTAKSIVSLCTLSSGVRDIANVIDDTQTQLEKLIQKYRSTTVQRRELATRKGILTQGVAVFEQLAIIRTLYDLYYYSLVPRVNKNESDSENKFNWYVDISTAYRAARQLRYRIQALPPIDNITIFRILNEKLDLIEEDIHPKIKQVINKCLYIKSFGPWKLKWSYNIVNSARDIPNNKSIYEYYINLIKKNTNADVESNDNLFIAAEIIMRRSANFVSPIPESFSGFGLDKFRNSSDDNIDAIYDAENGNIELDNSLRNRTSSIPVNVVLYDVLFSMVETPKQHLDNLKVSCNSLSADDSNKDDKLQLLTHYLPEFLNSSHYTIDDFDKEDILYHFESFCKDIFDSLLCNIIMEPLLEFDHSHGARLIDPVLIKLRELNSKFKKGDLDDKLLKQDEKSVFNKYSSARKVVTWANRDLVLDNINNKENLDFNRHEVIFSNELIKRIESVFSYLHANIPDYYPYIVQVLLKNYGEQLSALIISKCLVVMTPRNVDDLRLFESEVSAACVLLEDSILSQVNSICGDDGFQFKVRYSLREWETFKETVLNFTTPLIEFCSDVDNQFLKLTKSRCLFEARFCSSEPSWKPIRKVYRDGAVSKKAVRIVNILQYVEKHICDCIKLLSIFKRESTMQKTLDIDNEQNDIIEDANSDDFSSVSSDKTDARVCSTSILAMQLISILGDVTDMYVAMTMAGDTASEYSLNSLKIKEDIKSAMNNNRHNKKPQIKVDEILPENVTISNNGAIVFEKAGASAIFCNDCYYLAGEYTRLSARLVTEVLEAVEKATPYISESVYQKLIADAEMERTSTVTRGTFLMECGDAAWSAKLSSIEKNIKSTVETLDSIHLQTELQKIEIEKVISKCISYIRTSADEWSTLLNVPLYNSAIYTLFNCLTELLVDEVISLVDIGSTESVDLNETLQKVLRAGKELNVKISDRFIKTVEILDSSLADIHQMLNKGELLCLEKEELFKLIKSLFQQSPMRNSCLDRVSEIYNEQY